jgi:hypothetical protein
MISKRYFGVLGAGLGGYLLSVGLVGAIVTGRFPLDGAPLSAPNVYDEVVQQWQALLSNLPSAPPAASRGDGPWAGHIARLDEALARNDVRTAEQAWRDAHVEVLRTRRWEGMMALGDAHLRLGEVTGSLSGARAQARQAYLAALLRARNEGSPAGVLAAAEAFGGLGDRDVVDQALRIASDLVARADARIGEVAAFKEQLSARVLSIASP